MGKRIGLMSITMAMTIGATSAIGTIIGGLMGLYFIKDQLGGGDPGAFGALLTFFMTIIGAIAGTIAGAIVGSVIIGLVMSIIVLLHEFHQKRQNHELN